MEFFPYTLMALLDMTVQRYPMSYFNSRKQDLNLEDDELKGNPGQILMYSVYQKKLYTTLEAYN